MFPKQFDLGGDFESLASAYGRFIPRGTVAPARDWKLVRWKGHLTVSKGRSLWRVRANRDLTMRSDGNDGFFGLVIPEEGCVCTSVRGRDVRAVPGQAVLLHLPEDRNLEALCLGAHARTSLTWSAPEWKKMIAATLGDDPFAQSDLNALIDMSGERGQVFSRLVSAVAHDLVAPARASGLTSSLMNEALLRLVFDLVLHRGGAHRERETLPRHVRMAMDFMLANIAKPILIRDVAAACHVSPRSLEIGFRNHIDMTPLAYLRHIRLDAVRRELKAGSAGASVSAVARRWGFVDLGRFSLRYRRAFGERPSETLRRG